MNNALLQLGLRGRGYNNYRDENASGEAHFLQRVCRRDLKLCVDVGANVGRYSEALLCQSDATVYAFEPLPESFGKLSQLAGQFGGRLIPVNLGVADTSGSMPLYFGTGYEEWASLSSAVSEIEYVGNANKQRIDVMTTTLDDFFEHTKLPSDRIDLLKIDTEGFEAKVLLGAQRLVERYRPRFIQIEMNWHHLFMGDTLWRFSQLLRGYRTYQLLPYRNGMRPVQPKDPLSNIFEFANFVFVHPDEGWQPGD